MGKLGSCAEGRWNERGLALPCAVMTEVQNWEQKEQARIQEGMERERHSELQQKELYISSPTTRAAAAAQAEAETRMQRETETTEHAVKTPAPTGAGEKRGSMASGEEEQESNAKSRKESPLEQQPRRSSPRIAMSKGKGKGAGGPSNGGKHRVAGIMKPGRNQGMRTAQQRKAVQHTEDLDTETAGQYSAEAFGKEDLMDDDSQVLDY